MVYRGTPIWCNTRSEIRALSLSGARERACYGDNDETDRNLGRDGSPLLAAKVLVVIAALTNPCQLARQKALKNPTQTTMKTLPSGDGG